MITEADKTSSTAAEGAPLPGFMRNRAVIDAAPMADLITCARLFHAAINMRAADWSDDEMATLADFDDLLSELIGRRRPASPQEFAAKVRYLLDRAHDGNMSDAAETAAINGIMEDAALLCPSGIPLADPARLAPELTA